MRIRLRKPQEIIWLLAILLVIVGVVLSLGIVVIPGLSVAVLAFWLVVVAAALLILGTSVF